MSALSRRTIHLDFHTAPQIPDVGARFDSAAFAKTFERAGVDSVTVFAKCHHGHLYYDTDRAERHPTLSRDLNLLDEQVEALHRVGIRAPIYLSVQFDEYAANTHPEWLAIQPDGRQWKRTGRFEAGWQVLDMASPYQDYLADQLAEVLDHFGTVDGIFLDICMDIPSTSVWAVEAMRRRGQDPASEHDRDDHARQTARDYMHRYRQMILPHLAGDAPTSVWFNSRPKTALTEELPFVDHVEIEALPTGGWGYTYLPYVARLVRPMGHRALAHTARFHKSWGDNAGLKPAAALDYECAQMLTYGITACVGDVLHPSGRLAEPAYDLIEHSYRHLKECEPFVAQARPVAEVGVVMDLALGDEPGDVAIGLVRALQQLRQQFDVIGLDADLSGYRLIVVPETTVVDAELARRLLAFREAGGRLLLSGAALDNGHGEPCLPGLGITIEGPSPYSHVFWRKADGSDDFPHVDYENGLRLLATEDGVVRYTVVEPYFERTWDQFCGHDYTPPGPASPYAAVVTTERAAVFATPLFSAYGRNAATLYRVALGAVLDELLPDPLVRVSGPLHVETGVADTDGTRIVHLLSYLASRQAEGRSPLSNEVEGLDQVNDPFPLVGTPVEIRLAESPSAVTLQPHGRTLPFEYADGYVKVSVDIPDGHGMIVVSR